MRVRGIGCHIIGRFFGSALEKVLDHDEVKEDKDCNGEESVQPGTFSFVPEHIKEAVLRKETKL